MLVNRFRGGIELDGEQWKAHNADVCRIQIMPPPTLLRFPLADATGYCADPVVDVGESVLAGQPLTRSDDPLCPPVIASCSGTVTAISSINQALRAHPDSPPTLTLKVNQQTQEQSWQLPDTEGDVQRLLHLAGIRGLGGAAFPTSRKWVAPQQRITTLIINAAECEPLISCDEALILDRADELIESIELLRCTLQAPRCVIGIEEDKLKAVVTLQDAHSRHPYEAIEIVPIPARYPTGAERQLIKILTGLEVPYQQRPADIGVRCFNIATALAIKRLLKDRVVPTSRIVSVTGDAIASPANVAVKFGTPVMDLIRFVEPNLPADLQITQGGPLCGIRLRNHKASITAASNCLLVEHPKTPTRPAPCIRCGNCDDVCPQSLLPQQLHWYCNDGSVEDASRFHLDACIECGCCDLVCPSQLPLTAQFRSAKREKIARQEAQVLAERAKVRFEQHETRLHRREQQKQERLTQRKAEIDARRSKDPRDAIAAALQRSQKRQRKKPGDSA